MPSLTRNLTINSLDPAVRDVAQKLLQAVAAAGGRALLVGGAVRDALLGGHPKDLDIEVYHLPVERLEAVIASVGPFDAVGRSFGVYKLKYHPVDVSLPRRESKTSSGHRGFQVEGDPEMPFLEACSRRDFTLNAILWDPLNGQVIDPFNGQADLERGLLRHTSPHFAEDPLRVLRAMQFAARFRFDVAPATIELCAKIGMEGLPAERLLEEWKKLLLKGVQPSLGLHFLRASGWIKYFPELQALIDCPQDPAWHPEGDVWIHTLHCLDAFARERLGEPAEDLIVGLAVLLHDVGKPPTTQFIQGHWRSRAHDVVGVAIGERFLRRLTAEVALIDAVLPLIECHMRPRELYEAQASDAAIRRLARKVGRIDRLVRVAHADMQGRPPLTDPFPEGPWLLAAAQRLQVLDSIPQPLVLGRHLIQLGHTPSPAFKPLLDACYEAQLDGAFTDLPGGLQFLQTLLNKADK